MRKNSLGKKMTIYGGRWEKPGVRDGTTVWWEMGAQRPMLPSWDNLARSHVSLQGDLNLLHSQITNLPCYTNYIVYIILLIAIIVIDYKWNVYVTTTIENT